MSHILDQRYLMGTKRGAGPLGAVYKATDQQTGQTVAVKVLNPQAAQNAALRAAFANRKPPSSPAVMATLAVGQANGYLYRVTDYVNGPNLIEWLQLRQQPPGPQHLCGIAAQVADILGNQVHGNLKPTNILLEAGGHPRLTDAGLPSPAGRYTAPEVAAGQPPTARSDVYSLGVILDDLCRSANPPQSVRLVLARAAQSDPSRRYETVAALSDALQTAVTGKPPAVKASAQPKKISQGVWALAVLIPIGIIVLVGALLLSRNRPPSGASQASGPTAAVVYVSPQPRGTLPPTWTPDIYVPPTWTPLPTATPGPTAYPTLSPQQLANSYWDGDGYESMWDYEFPDGSYGRFDIFPINVWVTGYNGTVITDAHEAAIQNALNEINRVVPIVRVENRLFAHMTIWLMSDADFRQNAACGEYHDYAIACAVPNYTVAGILLVSIWLDTADECFTETILHEMTHGLGVMVHSPYPEDIMYFAQTCNKTRYSDRDIGTLTALYSVQPFHPSLDEMR